MASYKEKILEVIGEAEVGLTTVDVAKKAGVSKTTVIKYLSVLSSEGQVEFVEVGPSKLWRNKRTGKKYREEGAQTLNVDARPMVDIDFCNGEDNTVHFSFRVDPDRICSLLKRANKCMCKTADNILIEE
ncbi:MAG: FaeA/PapI family transcriptional regulator [Methanothrix sp.]|jgi:predicted ArsR family transcriptional regulator|nr:FaeA/PapI family transcriptional regulator [Methanothrix sp.]